ncbi:hypothetical protein CesoFtcFv8_027651 [Champsocephalus esox]|uniref:Uncharacterized protein n=1 Tax=Champsocephalus esox TaxID=159716 RepID=A0AAN7YFJ0_9TELE|nr:hypothetical protein CesoFtcFv8_027651 [Champsocephalus esox]
MGKRSKVQIQNKQPKVARCEDRSSGGGRRLGLSDRRVDGAEQVFGVAAFPPLNSRMLEGGLLGAQTGSMDPGRKTRHPADTLLLTLVSGR